jgi:hypothetical protein
VKFSPAPESFSEPFWRTETREIITLLVEFQKLLERKSFCLPALPEGDTGIPSVDLRRVLPQAWVVAEAPASARHGRALADQPAACIPTLQRLIRAVKLRVSPKPGEGDRL